MSSKPEYDEYMSRFVVPPTNYEVKLKDGSKYYPSPSGTIDVENKKHAQEIRNSTAMKKFDMIKEKSWTARKDVPSKTCERCLFEAFVFSSRCPRCDEPFNNEQGEQ